MALPEEAENVKSCGPVPAPKVIFVSTGTPPTVTVTVPPFHPSPKVSVSRIV